MYRQENYYDLWEKIEKAGTPCKINLLCKFKKTYTGPGREYTPLWSLVNDNVPIILDEVKQGKENVFWGRLKSGDGWIELTDVQLYE